MNEANVSVVLISWCPDHIDEYRLSLLRKTVASLRSCTDVPYTLVCVDNGGAKQTEYLRSIQPDIHIINKVNPGPGIARNQGAAATQSKYIAFLDSDIELYAGWLSNAIAILEKFPDRKLVVVPTRCSSWKKPQNRVGSIDGGYELWRMASGYCMIWPRTACQEVGLWCDSYTDPIEDRDYSNRAYALGWQFVWPPKGYVLHMGKRTCFKRNGHNRRGFFNNGNWV